jgi:hypothetical protein
VFQLNGSRTLASGPATLRLESNLGEGADATVAASFDGIHYSATRSRSARRLENDSGAVPPVLNLIKSFD